MFTGIIKNIGTIKTLTKKNNGYFLSVKKILEPLFLALEFV
jgi:riboflavin synthase alpha subunit